MTTIKDLEMKLHDLDEARKEHRRRMKVAMQRMADGANLAQAVAYVGMGESASDVEKFERELEEMARALVADDTPPGGGT